MSRSGIPRRRMLLALAGASATFALGPLGCLPSRRRDAEDPAGMDLLEAARAIRSRALSSPDLTRACLERITRFDARIGAFITVDADGGHEQAKAAEIEIAGGRWRGPLHGIPIAVKDNLDVAGIRITAGSAAYPDRIPERDAEAVRRLRAAGAVILGKLNLHELGVGATSAISAAGPVRNPWDPARIAGGSSGGAAAALAACFCYGTVGSDTGGSIRIPAACCGVVGLKPGFGVVSTDGLVPMAPSFDCVGPLARTVADAAALLAAMTDDPVAARFDPEAPPPVDALRAGVLRDLEQHCDAVAEPEVQTAFDEAVEVIRSIVSRIGDARIPVPDIGALVEAEAYATHAARLDAAPGLFAPRTRDALLGGRGIDTREVERLRRELERHRVSVRAAFADVDVALLPTLPSLPWRIADASDPFAFPACTFGLSLAGIPALAIPCGFSGSGLPIGLTLAGPPGSEATLLALAHAYQLRTDWHRRRATLGGGD